MTSVKRVSRESFDRRRADFRSNRSSRDRSCRRSLKGIGDVYRVAVGSLAVSAAPAQRRGILWAALHRLRIALTLLVRNRREEQSI
jgi:hypothetical protein